jgi:hypothetical protein
LGKWEVYSLNNRGQFSIIAALLVAVVLITTVVVTYSTIRNSPIREQPQIQSAIDETNLAVKEILGFTVGYYGSILQSTGNQTYAQGLAMEYLQGGLEYTASMHPEWGTSFDVTNSSLVTYWYTNSSYSSGNLGLSYNLTGLGIYGITYQTFCSLGVQIMPTINTQAYLNITQDGTQPLINLGKTNFNFYHYVTADSKWDQIHPANDPMAYSNGTYQMDIPSGIDVNSYLIQVEDQRGIMVVASSFSTYTCNLAWTAWNTTVSITQHYVDNNSSDVDSSQNIGTHSNFTAMQHGPDGVMDTLTEGITTSAIPERWVSPFQYEGNGWTNPSYAYDNNTSTKASASISKNSWSSYLILDSSAISCHNIRYYISRSATQINTVKIDIYAGSWINVYNGPGTWDQWTNVTFTEMSVTKMRFRFYNSHNSQTLTAYVAEAQFLRTATPQNCQLDIEAQWTNVNYTSPNQWLCIYGGTMASEDIRVDVRKGSNWINLFTNLVSGWNNISVSQYVSSPTFTIRFKDGSATSDPVQDSWQIDTALLQSGNTAIPTYSTGDTIVAELQQNGIIRWLGQNLQLTMQAKPFPPIPAKSIHVNQTIANVTSEVPFQIEDWASGYTIPMGLTNNASVFSGTNMLVFLANSNVSQVTIWWNGSDRAIQTPYAYTNKYFTGDDVANGVLTNGILKLNIDSSFTVTSTQNTSTSTTTFMRINGQGSTYGSIPSYAIHHGVIRDIVHQEAEWSNGALNCPNLYAHIVLTLPANATYYTYQLRLMFVDSQQSRTITNLCPLSLSIPNGGPETEDGVSGGNPNTSNSTGLFYDQSAADWAHHWSQFISGTKGAGIMFTDSANQELYVFDSIAGNATGAISVSNSSGNVIELQPVSARAPVSFKYALDVIWYGAVATFDGRTPIYEEVSGLRTGLWTLVEFPPTVTVTTGN